MERNNQSKLAALACAVTLAIAPPILSRTIYVDDDGPADFITIQAAVDDANDGDIVLVAPGTYTGPGNRDIDFKGKAITIRSEQGPETCIINCQGTRDDYHYGFAFRHGEDANSVLQGLTITKGYMKVGGAGIVCEYSSPTIRGCIITSNRALNAGVGIRLIASDSLVENCIITGNCVDPPIWGAAIGVGVSCSGVVDRHAYPILRNCTIVGNRGSSGVGVCCDTDGVARIENCIVTGNVASLLTSKGTQISSNSCTGVAECMDVEIRNCAVEDVPNAVFVGAWSHPFSSHVADYIKVDPLFVDSGHWEPNDTASVLDDFWVQGDYHLKSQAGRWDPNAGSWVQDDVTSPCIDAGDPNTPVGDEPFPNGGRINMGAYGGTAEASKSYFGQPVCHTIVPGDINGDCKTDLVDLTILAGHWLEDHSKCSRVTTTCRFIAGQSSMNTSSRVPHSDRVGGEFRLTIDWAAGVAVFDEVSATFGAETGHASDLDAFFHMTEMVSTDVNTTFVKFVFRKNIPRFPGADVQVAVTFRDGFVRLTGGFTVPAYDGASYRLDAVAVPVDDPRSSPSIAQMLETAIAGDINSDCRVGLMDLAIMANNWQIRLPTRR